MWKCDKCGNVEMENPQRIEPLINQDAVLISTFVTFFAKKTTPKRIPGVATA
jgi:hypothetical protein